MKKLCVELSKHVISNTSLACFSFADNLRVVDELLVAPVFPHCKYPRSNRPCRFRVVKKMHGMVEEPCDGIAVLLVALANNRTTPCVANDGRLIYPIYTLLG